ncbi:MAG TPA: AAA family ATPase [Terriglobales bacterium]|nr:AAA family ATPase [Terriglobales bacterium]
MLVTRITLKNWRNFRQVDVPVGSRVFLVGPNASGKSNFLDVFVFLRDLAKAGGGLQKAVSDRGGISRIRCLAARQDPDVELQIELAGDDSDKWTYSVGIKQESRGYRQPYLSFERVTHNGSDVVSRPDKNDQQDPLRRTQTYLEQISANSRFRPVARFFEAIDYLHLVPQLIKHPEAFVGPVLPGDPYGKSFLERVARTPEKTRRSRLRRIEAALRIAVPQLSELSDVKDEAGIPHLEAVYRHWRPKGAKQREDQFSDGTLRLIGLLWSLLEGSSLLLLEEPELSLNSGIIRKLPALMYRIQRQRERQLIVSTHSPDLLSDPGIGGEEMLLLTPSEEGTRVELASSNSEIRDLLEGGMSLADAAIPKTAPEGLPQLDLFQ